MPYSDFFMREQVYVIIRNTLEDYFECDVEFSKRIHSDWEKSKVFFCYERLGIILPYYFSNKLIDHVYRAFRISTSFSRKIVMALYLLGVKAMPSVFSNMYMYIDSDMIFENLLIEPGNKKLKLFDYEKDEIINLQKVGFQSSWMEKEIEYRENNKKPYILPIRRIPGGYIEPLVFGYSYARLSVTQRARLNDQVSTIWKDCFKTKHEVLACDYIQKLYECVVASISTYGGTLEKTSVKNLLYFLDLLKRHALKEGNIKIVQSHGDLQYGNLLWDAKKNIIYLIDWETWADRSVYYDLLLFHYGYRNSNKLAQSIAIFMGEKGSRLFGRDLSFKEMSNAIVLFIFEDLIWQFEEMSTLPSNAVPNGLHFYLEQKHHVIVQNLLKLGV